MKGGPCKLWFSNFTVHQNPLEGLFKEKFLGPVPKVPNSARWGPRTCISDKFSGDTGAAHLRTAVRGPLMHCVSSYRRQVLFNILLMTLLNMQKV